MKFCEVTGVFGEQYDITVVTDPPSGPFLIGNRITFTCHVYPIPPEPVTYSWHAMKDASGPTTLSSGQNATHYTPSYYRDLHFSWFFCKVFSNESLIGVGRKLVEIHGKSQAQIFDYCTCRLGFSSVTICCSFIGILFSVKPLFRTFILGSTIELQVNISSDYSAARHIRTLIWYHNDTEVHSSDRISVLNSGRMIIIRDTTHADAGIYKVEIASHFGDGPVCDSLWLPLLRNHAAHAPVTFTLRLMNESLSSQCK